MALNTVDAWVIDMKCLLSLALVILAGCSPIFDEDGCKSSAILAAKSADEKYVATIADRDCGATTARAKIVYLRAADASVPTNEYGEPVYIYAGQANIAMEWESGTLVIKSTSKGDNVFLAKRSWRDVDIRYK
ncbi:hypothetical protein [Mitsuaria sp. GD03876]|uniref:hypothetical protein n=1 Tax=Mitsuaria sp. GD03876 TaxID=2975399 RepID=UPI00244B9E4B|nr:hypothetical protein [Mitsuaria sp. GD03876]MDH0864095.1 hypothetical protein [Mitsuaria sp. GD03876]